VAAPHGIYVDDDIYLDVSDTCRFEQAIAASIEAIFNLLGESNMALREDPISWEKLHELLVAPNNRILGLVLDLCSMTVGTPPEFISATIALLSSTWSTHRRTFKVREAEELAGKLNHIAFKAPWLKYLLSNIYASLAAALRLNNSHLMRTSKTFCLALCAICHAPPSTDGDAQRAYHSRATARLIHGCKLLHHISGDLRRDLRLIERAMSAAHTPKTCPIAHLIPQVPYGVARSDSSLTATGAYQGREQERLG
jgi:hypothetical protein